MHAIGQVRRVARCGDRRRQPRRQCIEANETGLSEEQVIMLAGFVQYLVQHAAEYR